MSDTRELTEKLRARDADWQTMCDRVIAKAGELDQPLSAEAEAAMRTTLHCQAADAIATLEAEATELREKVARQLAETQRAWNEKDGEKRQRLAAEAALKEANAQLDKQAKVNNAEIDRLAKEAVAQIVAREAAEAALKETRERLSENNRWPDPLKSPQAEAIRNGKIDMTDIVSLFDKMERELIQHRCSQHSGASNAE